MKNKKFMALENDEYEERLKEARKKAREGRKEAPLGRVGAKVAAKAGKMARKKAAQGSNSIFYVLLIIALILDLIEYLDLGTFTTLVNIGAYVIVAVGGFVAWFVKSGGENRFSIFNLLKGQLWKYLILPIFEWIPIINVLPFWTGTVVMMWVKFSIAKRKVLDQEGEAG